jgi:hypothetical protein
MPGIFLKQVDVDQCKKNFNLLIHLSDLPKVDIKIKTGCINIIDNDKNKNYFLEKDNISKNHTYYTTNCLYFNTVLSTGASDKSSELKCDWCHRSIDGYKNACGIPIRKTVYGDVEVFDTLTANCSLRCALALYYRDHTKYDEISRIYMHAVYKKYFSKELVEAPDPKLLIKNGGSLTDDEYDAGVYKNSNKVIFLPAKRVFELLELEKNSVI